MPISQIRHFADIPFPYAFCAIDFGGKWIGRNACPRERRLALARQMLGVNNTLL